MISQEILDQLYAVTDEEQKFLDGCQDIDRGIYMEGNGNQINSSKLLATGRQITIRKHTRFVHFPKHTHDYVEVVYMVHGTTTHFVNGEKVVLQQGDLLFMGQGSVQEILPAGMDDIAINFIILPSFFDTTLELIGPEDTPMRRFVVDCLKSSDNPTSYLYFHVSNVESVQNLVENLILSQIDNFPNHRSINQTTMALLFLNLLNYTDHLAYQNEDEEVIMKTLRYIENHYADGSLTELSRELHYDPSWMSREIKKRTGKKFVELIQQKRLAQAVFLLENTDINIDDIAYQIGYENLSYFYRLFRKTYGVSPKKYRTEHKK